MPRSSRHQAIARAGPLITATASAPAAVLLLALLAAP